MISLIVSSYKPHIFNTFSANIAETCGIPFEIIKIENPGIMGLCEAYNRGAKQAKYENLLFIHEDVKFHTENWGLKFIKHLEEDETGLIGIAGSDYVPAAPSGWYINDMNHQFLYLIQNTKEQNNPKFDNFVTKEKHQVYALDGVFLGIRKKIFNKFKFNEELKGFHAYDIEISLNVAKKYKNFVISDILIEHFSLGSPNKEWFDGMLFVRKTHGSNYQKTTDKKVEKERFEGFIYSYFRYYGINLKSVFATLQFLPFGKLSVNDCFDILKTYFRYFKHKDYFEKKFGV